MYTIKFKNSVFDVEEFEMVLTYQNHTLYRIIKLLVMEKMDARKIKKLAEHQAELNNLISDTCTIEEIDFQRILSGNIGPLSYSHSQDEHGYLVKIQGQAKVKNEFKVLDFDTNPVKIESDFGSFTEDLYKIDNLVYDEKYGLVLPIMLADRRIAYRDETFAHRMNEAQINWKFDPENMEILQICDEMNFAIKTEGFWK
jgi:hypothetical protein